MIIEETGSKILTDPGVWSDLSLADLNNIDAVLITHEHSDHYDPKAIKNLVDKNPKIKFISNTAVSRLLKQLDIDCEILEHGQSMQLGKIKIEAFGNDHAEIYKDFGKVQNTGFLLADKLFYSGDAFTLPKRMVDTLALPVCAPWLHIKESINYALAVKPKQTFPVHDGMLKFPGSFHALPKKILEENGITFISPELLKPFEI
jgi:L-ascorbate metabolism protein UlaG (beta-lactamase superfamily)